MEIINSKENAINFFRSYVKKNKAMLAGKYVYDLSAGTGYIANLFHDLGAVVSVQDLFPDKIKDISINGESIDLQKNFPIGDNQADLVVLCDTIEYLPNQFFFFKEVSRILKPGGTLILTDRNPSSLNSRFSQFLMESEHYSYPLPSDKEAYSSWPSAHSNYLRKIFKSGVLRLRVLAALHSLEVKEIHKTSYSATSFLFLVFYPLIYFLNRRILNGQLKESPEDEMVYRSIFKISTSLRVLLSKYLVIEFSKK